MAKGSYDAPDRAAVTMAYDSASRRTSLTLPNGVVIAYACDADARPMGAVSASFGHDGFGRRLTKTVGGTMTGLLYDGLNPVQELAGGLPAPSLVTGGVGRRLRGRPQ